jgi:hypothetical protein
MTASLLALGLSACEPKAADAPKTEASDAAAVAPCRDDGPRLPGTGICQSSVHAFLTPAEGAEMPGIADGCSWGVNETMLPQNEALLYNAMTCNGVTTKLAFAGGASKAILSYETSALGATQGKDLIELWGVDPDPQGALKAAIAALPAGEQAVCVIEPAGVDGWPKDALVIRPNAAARASMPNDGPIAACGPYGVDEDSATYWRIAQGYAWFFDLGQDQLDFDPGSITVISNADGNGWIIKP